MYVQGLNERQLEPIEDGALKPGCSAENLGSFLISHVTLGK